MTAHNAKLDEIRARDKVKYMDRWAVGGSDSLKECPGGTHLERSEARRLVKRARRGLLDMTRVQRLMAYTLGHAVAEVEWRKPLPTGRWLPFWHGCPIMAIIHGPPEYGKPAPPRGLK